MGIHEQLIHELFLHSASSWSPVLIYAPAPVLIFAPAPLPPPRHRAIFPIMHPRGAPVLVLLCLLPATTSKRVAGALSPTEQFQYVGKFTFGAGLGTMAFRVPPALMNKNAHVVLYMDEIWDEVRTAATCKHQKRARDRGQHNTELVNGQHTSTGLFEVKYSVNIAV